MRAKLLTLICSLWASACFEAAATTDVLVRFDVQPNSIQWDTSHTALTFMCRVVIENKTADSLTVSNLFQSTDGLCMKVASTNGVQLASLISAPFKFPVATIDAGKNLKFWPYYGIFGLFDPGTNTSVKLQLEGKLAGSSYPKSVVSDVVDMKIP
jgi:hypothetical protein